MVNQFDFQGVEKALGYGIIPAIAFFAHTGFCTVSLEGFPIIIGGILAAPVAMEDQAFVRLSLPGGHQYGIID